jgi:hypothetical protein
MTVHKVIRYQTKPEQADENARLIDDVFAELAIRKPEGLHYTAYRLDDGVSFVHVVALDGDANPLPGLPAFARFQSGIDERCAVAPLAADATIVGHY